jgi:hypothetical protein
LAQFNAAFVDLARQAVPAQLYDYNKEFALDGKFLPVTSNGPTNNPYANYNDFTESIIAKSFYDGPYNGNGFRSDYLVLTPQTQALFGQNDLRLNFYAAKFPFNTPNPSGRLSKYSLQYSKFGLQLSDLYLLRAECKARLNDLTGAKTDVETLRKNRMPATDAVIPNAIATNQAALIRFVFEERIREFAVEGYRWFDMRRQSVDPIFNGQTYTHTVYSDPSAPVVYTLRTDRLTFRIPDYLMLANPKLVNNP